jgi:[ribosomal protein S18]-alanine N-acetyltransferase
MSAEQRTFRAQSLVIRPMQIQDIDRVHQIDVLSFSLPWPKGSYRFELLENNGSQCLVGEIFQGNETTEIVGMIVTWLIVDEAHIASVAVHPDYRRLGYGEQLVITAMRHALKTGMKFVTLEVRASNLPAQTLYQKLGFEIAGRRLRYYKDNQEDAIIMTVRLNEGLRSLLDSNHVDAGGRR